MTDMGFYEKVVQPPAKNKRSLGRTVAVIIYGFIILSCVVSMLFSHFITAFIAEVIATLLLYFLLESLDYEYEYSFSEAGITLCKIFAKSTKTLFVFVVNGILIQTLK